MNNTFNAKRFGFLFRKALLERPAQMMGFTGLTLAVILIIYFLCKSLMGFSAAQNLAFIWGLAGGSCFLGSMVFGQFSSNASGSSYLTLPASAFEKWLCGILVAGILYPIIFLVFFRMMDTGFVALYHHSLDPSSPIYAIEYKSVYLFAFDGRIAKNVYTTSFLFTGVALVGSLYFNRAGFIKTALAFCAICFAVFALNWLVADLLFGRIDGAFPFHDVEISLGKAVGSVDLSKKAFTITIYFFDFILPATLWIASYIRLREKEF